MSAAQDRPEPAADDDGERAPLLSRTISAASTASYYDDRFSPARKHAILAVVSLAGLVSLFVPGSFIPSIPQAVEDLDSSPAVVSLAVSIFIVTAALGNLFWASYSNFYGRRPIYLTALSILVAGSALAALAPSAPTLLVARGVQAVGAAAEIVGPAVVAEVFARRGRGRAIGWFMSACQLGPALAPFLGGALAHWHSWRTTQAAIAIAASAVLVLVFFLLPETSRPGTRGVDNEQAEGGRRWKLLNPLGCFGVFRSPSLFAVALACAFVLFTDYVLCVPLPYTVGAAYGITSPAAIGAFFLPVGAGNLLGAPLAGHLSDAALRRHTTATPGARAPPELRLAPALLAGALLVPGSALGAGLVIALVPGRAGIAAVCALLFVHGIGTNMVLGAAAAYGVDCARRRAAEVQAANAGLRAATTALLAPAVVPLLEHIGVLATFSIAAGVGLLGAGLLWLVWTRGERMREWVDIGWDHKEDE